VLPTRALGEGVAQEWAGQGERLDPASLPLTQLANTALDRTSQHREAMAAEFARHCVHDLVCFPAPAPEGLARMQAAQWGRVREGVWVRHGLDLSPVAGLARTVSPQQEALAVELALGRDDFGLTGLVYATALFGSAGLGLMLADGEMDAQEAFALSRLEQAWQEAHWGVDAEAQQRTQAHARDADAVGRWFALLAQA
jgi:chaperone required for assembly of F1-ATPase